MNAIYGHRWRSNFSDSDSLEAAKLVWSQQLGGLTRRQLRMGVARNAKLSDWNPSVSEFLRAACGLPRLETCIERVKRGANTDPVSYRISSMIGQYEMRNLSYANLARRVKGLYTDVYQSELLKSIGSDVEFQPVRAVEKPLSETDHFVKASREECRENLAAISKMLKRESRVVGA